MFQLCGALEHLHKYNTLHRDLKPANIFLCNGGRLVKLGDFGLVNVLESSLDVAKSNVGTPCYNLTPELLQTGGQSKAADMWSLGVCLVECCTLEQPFVKDSKNAGGDRFVNSIVELGKAILGDQVDKHPRLYIRRTSQTLFSRARRMPQPRSIRATDCKQIAGIPILCAPWSDFSNLRIILMHAFRFKQLVGSQDCHGENGSRYSREGCKTDQSRAHRKFGKKQ